MVGLQDAGLMWAELFEFGFEESGFLVRCRFLIQDEDITDVIIVDLQAGVNKPL